jgi:hypothetical protein
VTRQAESDADPAILLGVREQSVSLVEGRAASAWRVGTAIGDRIAAQAETTLARALHSRQLGRVDAQNRPSSCTSSRNASDGVAAPIARLAEDG